MRVPKANPTMPPATPRVARQLLCWPLTTVRDEHKEPAFLSATNSMIGCVSFALRQLDVSRVELVAPVDDWRASRSVDLTRLPNAAVRTTVATRAALWSIGAVALLRRLHYLHSCMLPPLGLVARRRRRSFCSRSAAMPCSVKLVRPSSCRGDARVLTAAASQDCIPAALGARRVRRLQLLRGRRGSGPKAAASRTRLASPRNVADSPTPPAREGVQRRHHNRERSQQEA